ncbi:uncharacterized protein BX663DRAFT_487159 [Cokeromyces recurvatus]|uniref:uncharacterized protein n=1 Tax=Cokeromyces recurvatus TaxID=90255 RepID=UPI002220E461|nr:uncharacterized protein BX663DRAFT_487159 [Cokeromyces recurvatus]KAI7901876.1 hypothetical protein BX663DRAFT_487159 [Cokeromyces recurvatus]
MIWQNSINNYMTNVYHNDYITYLSSYTARGSRWTEDQAKSIIIADEISTLINSCYQLRELYIGEEIMHVFASPKVIQIIFSQQNRLNTIDLTGFCDRNCTQTIADFFKPKTKKRKLVVVEKLAIEELDNDELEDAVNDHWSIPRELENISFYMCMALSQEHFFIPFFKKLSTVDQELRKLDLAYTQITSELFLHLKNMTKLTHLNLQGCHSLSCCSPLICFLQNNCRELKELNINMDFNGIGGSQFCSKCISKIIRFGLHTTQSLDMSGHTHLDDSILNQILITAEQQDHYFTNLRYFSIAYCQNISLRTLKRFLVRLPNVVYLNLAHTPLTTDANYLTYVLKIISSITEKIRVIEFSPFSSRKYPIQIENWRLINQGRRTYYALEDIGSPFFHSRKIILSNDKTLSPMNKYWSYSY